jgi:hypothetical protein
MTRLTEPKIIKGAFLLAALLLWCCGRPALAAPDPWPKRFENPKGTVVMYQPQLEDVQDDKITGRAAVSVKKKEWKAPVFGAVWLSGQVRTDRDTRLANISNVQVTDAKFPNAAPEQMEKLKTFLNTEMSGWSIPMSLDRLLAAMEVVEKAQAMDQGLKNEPPKIIFSTRPTVLVPLDGAPKLLPVPKSTLMRVANTPFIMFYEPASKVYYLRGGNSWLAAPGLQEAWQDVETLPASLKALDDEIKKAGKSREKGGGKRAETQGDQKPAVLVSTVPTELLVTTGEPQYTPIAGTNLLYVSNSDDNIFMDTASQEYYTLLSGRWFKSKSLADGPWAYVAPNQLPADFAKIPENSVKGFVLVNVAGTPQAKEAVLENSIPQTGVIDRKKATTEVKYAGDPKFEKIADTNLENAVNTDKPVFKEGAKYYAVDQGVWYEADSANGPWRVSVSPPQDVNKIPPSNPNYNTKYLKVYDSTDDTVTVGYTPGYTGSYVDNGTVVYGTGYQYPGYASETVYLPPPAPVTYGYAATYDPYAGSWGYAAPYYNPATWLTAGLAAAAVGVGVAALTSPWWHGAGFYGGGGWWGPGGYNNVNINNIHNNYINPRPPRPPGPPGPRPPGPPGPRPPHWGPDHRPGGPSTLPANRPNLYNRPGNQNLVASRPGAGPGQPGVRPGQPETRPGRPGAAAKPRPTAKPAQPTVRPAGGKNNVVADRNGNVYRRDNQGNWQQRQGNQWSKPGAGQAAARPSQRSQAAARPVQQIRPTQAQRPSYDSHSLNRDFQARQRGERRAQNYQRHPSAGFRPPGGGSGTIGPVSRPGGGGGARPSGGFSRPSGGGGGGPRGGGGGGGHRGGGGGGRRR